MYYIFACDYGGTVGMGHLTRCKAIADALKTLVNPPIRFLVPNRFEATHLPYEVESAANPQGVIEQSRIDKWVSPGDTVICDTRTAWPITGNVFVDPPYSLEADSADMVIFPHLHTTSARQQMAATATGPGPWVVTGHVLMSDDVIGRTLLDKSTLPQNQVLFAAGSTDADDILLSLYQLSLGLAPELTCTFMVGLAYTGGLKSWTLATDWSYDLMATASVSVCMMGVTVYELLRLGTPVLVVPRDQIDEDAVAVLQAALPDMVWQLPQIGSLTTNLLDATLDTALTHDTASYAEAIALTTIGDQGANAIAQRILTLQG